MGTVFQTPNGAAAHVQSRVSTARGCRASHVRPRQTCVLVREPILSAHFHIARRPRAAGDPWMPTLLVIHLAARLCPNCARTTHWRSFAAPPKNRHELVRRAARSSAPMFELPRAAEPSPYCAAPREPMFDGLPRAVDTLDTRLKETARPWLQGGGGERRP